MLRPHFIGISSELKSTENIHEQSQMWYSKKERSKEKILNLNNAYLNGEVLVTDEFIQHVRENWINFLNDYNPDKHPPNNYSTYYLKQGTINNIVNNFGMSSTIRHLAPNLVECLGIRQHSMFQTDKVLSPTDISDLFEPMLEVKLIHAQEIPAMYKNIKYKNQVRQVNSTFLLVYTIYCTITYLIITYYFESFEYKLIISVLPQNRLYDPICSTIDI